MAKHKKFEKLPEDDRPAAVPEEHDDDDVEDTTEATDDEPEETGPPQTVAEQLGNPKDVNFDAVNKLAQGRGPGARKATKK